MATTAATSLSTDSDLDLATRHRYGDAAAFEEVYRRFARMVFNLAYRMAGTVEEAEDLALASAAGRQVLAALGQVRPVFREAVVLRDLEGLSYDEIAKILKVRIGTVRSRIARGRDRLRIVLETTT